MTDDKTIQAAGPYTIVIDESTSYIRRIKGPNGLIDFCHEYESEAVRECDELNAAYRAGQASRPMPVGVERTGVGEYVVRFGPQPPSVSVDQIMELVESVPVLIPIERFFNPDGSHITKQEYGAIFHEVLCADFRSRLSSLLNGQQKG